MRLCDLKEKEVINSVSCRRLGFVTDVDFCMEKGKVLAIIVAGPGHLCFFLGRETEFIIPFCDILQVGEDIILVNIDEEECLQKCKY